MSLILWCTLFILKYLCLFSLKSIVLGIFLLTCRFSISILIRIHLLSWYSLIFFLVYIGGLLVLFIYISSLKFNPAFYFTNTRVLSNSLMKIKVVLCIIIILSQVTWKFRRYGWGKFEKNNYRLNLFNERERIFLINVGVLLLLVLWIITKLSFRKRGALRPYFN